jgi:UDP-galactopyranose mutase
MMSGRRKRIAGKSVAQSRVAQNRVAIVGAGFSGAVIARVLADAGLASLVMDERDHVAGNCHTARDSRTGIMVHRYGPHIFHTDKPHVWAYVTRFADMAAFILRVKSTVRGQVYALPINLHTINQFFGRAMNPAQARAFVAAQARADIANPASFEEHALRHLGAPLYEAFLRGYTRKQWGIEPSMLPAAVLKRLPLRFDYNDNYFDHPWQGIPRDGYSALVERILDHPLIELRLKCRFEEVRDESFTHTFYSGGIDRFYGYDLGRLPYRTLDFEQSYHPGDYQGTAVMNHPDEDIAFTRVTEHRHFAPWETPPSTETVVFHEFSRACAPNDTPFYPVNLLGDARLLGSYRQRAAQERAVTFVGRLGQYQYLDMDMTIDQALMTARAYLQTQGAAVRPSKGPG